MKIKRYEGVSEQAVVQQVKAELGPQAIIVSIKAVRAQGFLGAFKKPRVEIMAAYEEPGEILADDAEITSPFDVAVELVRETNGQLTRESNGQSMRETNGQQKAAAVSAPGNRTAAPNSSTAAHANALKENREFAAGLKDAYKDQLIEEQAERIKLLENSVNSAQDMLGRLSGKLSVERHKAGKAGKRYKNNIIQVFFESMIEQGVTEEVAAAVLDGLDAAPGPSPESGLDLNDIVKMVYANIINIIGKPSAAYAEHSVRTAAETFLNDRADDRAAQEVAQVQAGQNQSGQVQTNPDGEPFKTPVRRRRKVKPRKPFIAVFLGPTGVGKTTTIAKLSADFVLNKNVKISLISADTYRIAAVEQLRTYADILDINLGVVYNPDDLAEQLEVMGVESDVILVDTAGRSHKHEENMEELTQFLAAAKDCHKYLVLSLTTKFEDMLEIVNTYSQLTNFNIIFTKMDETKTLGSVLNLCYATGKPVSYITFGQNVPNDIRVMHPEEIAKAILCGF